MGAMTLRLDGMLVPVMTGGNSRRAKLTIERDGSLQLIAAPDVQKGELEQFLASKRDWIYRKLADKEAFSAEPVTKELVDGEGFLYLGRSHQLRVVSTDDRRVRLQKGRLVLPRSVVGTGYEQIIDWYRATGLAGSSRARRTGPPACESRLRPSRSLTSAISGARRYRMVGCGSTGRRCNSDHRSLSTSLHMSSHTFGSHTTDQHFGKSSAEQCLILTSERALWPKPAPRSGWAPFGWKMSCHTRPTICCDDAKRRLAERMTKETRLRTTDLPRDLIHKIDSVMGA